MGIVLGIDTTERSCSVSLVSSGSSLAQRMSFDTVATEQALALIFDTLRDAEVGLERVSKIAVAVGPGSFTGIRSGVSIAYGLSCGLDGVPVCGVSVLCARALPYRSAASFLIPILTASNTEKFYCIYASNQTNLSHFPQVGMLKIASNECLEDCLSTDMLKCLKDLNIKTDNPESCFRKIEVDFSASPSCLAEVDFPATLVAKCAEIVPASTTAISGAFLWKEGAKLLELLYVKDANAKTLVERQLARCDQTHNLCP
ncbi:MAG: tRNA (adenosine(37)-N6)-threonylcarbamoyltransferase complex dimerization subunit type 1 TsaB [Deltaproteobacteria bacterium]|nr:tRNA (adenosine(37)-N6)-threonylcarbamoyltransferase complex dimerization subunit type 1 TsaB [Deltaproteobacteria bacterium]